MKKIHPVLLKNYNSFSDWEAAVETITDSKEKGDAMEYLTYFLLKSNSVYYNIKEIYMEDEIPEVLRIQLKLEHKDNGVDGVILRNDGKLVAYQVKFRSGHNIPTARELATFWSESEYADMRLICANCATLPKVSSKKKNQMSLLLDKYLELDKNFFNSFLDYLKGNSSSQIFFKKAAPEGEHLYQKELIRQIVDGLSANNRGKFIAACGTGKTLIAMWAQEKLKAQNILFVVPSLALIKQTLDSWIKNCNMPFHYLCVCSDSTVLSEEDNIVTTSSEVDFPVTTNPNDILRFLSAETPKKVIFVTYNSLDAISNALLDTSCSFDLGIFDESHRTAGTKDSLMFVYGMEDRYIPIQKRLFMTATEKLVSPRVKNMLQNTENIVFSMDDVSKYGPTLASLNFGQAIEKQIICDYRIVVCTITENDIADLISSHKIVTTELGETVSSASIDILLKEVLIGKAMKELNITKAISYHSFVKNARTFIQGNREIHPVGHIIDDIFADTRNICTYTNYVDGTMPAAKRKEILKKFEHSERGLISNAKCLTEGVDVPAVDAVYFVDPKNSMIDIVQAIGRALRKSPSKRNNCAYIIVPVVIPDHASLFSHIAPSSFDTLHNVIQAMRSQDSTLADLIDEINFSAATGTSGKKGTSLSSKILHMPYSKINIQDFENSLTLRIAEVNKNPAGTGAESNWREKTLNPRKSNVKRVFTSLGDYSLNAYLHSLILPTLEKFSNVDAEMEGSDIRFNNNNLSHSVRMGILSKKGRNYRITPIGKALLADKSIYPSIAREQILKYFCINKKSGAVLFPYRTLLKILMTYDYISKIEFLYCIYPLQDTGDSSVQQAISRIQYLRDTYPNLDILNDTNKEKVLNILNIKYDIPFGFKDVWTSETTTNNQFSYFKKHLWIFDNIFITTENRVDKKKIQIYPGAQSSIQELLNLTSDIETAAISGDLDRLNELYCNRICSVLL